MNDITQIKRGALAIELLEHAYEYKQSKRYNLYASALKAYSIAKERVEDKIILGVMSDLEKKLLK